MFSSLFTSTHTAGNRMLRQMDQVWQSTSARDDKKEVDPKPGQRRAAYWIMWAETLCAQPDITAVEPVWYPISPTRECSCPWAPVVICVWRCA